MCGPAQTTLVGVENFVAAATVVPTDYNVPGAESESFSFDDEFGSLFSWSEELSGEGLDYFVALDAVAAESSPRWQLAMCLVYLM
jgi:hypothetical protein